MAHVDDIVASTIRPDRHLATATNLQPLWLLLGSLAALILCIGLFSWLFPPDIGIGIPTIRNEPDRIIVTSQIVNHTIHPVELRLRFKIFLKDGGIRGSVMPRAFGTEDTAIKIAGTADTMVRCEFPRGPASPEAAAAEVQILSR